MVTVRDQAGRQAIVSQLVPDIVAVSVQMDVRSVTEMRAHAGPGVDGRLDLVGVRVGVSDRDEHAAIGRAANERGGFGVFGGQCDQADLAAGRVLQALELVPVGRPTRMQRMCAAGPIDGRDVGALQVDAGHTLPHRSGIVRWPGR